MCTRSFVRALVTAGLALALCVAGPATQAFATGTSVSNVSEARDFSPDIAESPDGSRLTAVWISDVNVEVKDRDVRIATSTDGGATWSPERVIFQADVGAYLEEARIAYDTNGNLHVVFMSGLGGGRSVFYRFLPAGGDPAEPGQWRDGGLICTNCLNPDLAVDRSGNVYVLFEEGSHPANYLGIRGKAGGSGGWGPVRQIATGQRLRGTLAVTPDGRLHVAYYAIHADQADNVAFYEQYTSYDSFGREARVAISTSAVVGRPEIIVSPSGRLHMVWDQREASCASSGKCPRIVWYREYANGGLSDPVPVSEASAGHRGATVAADASDNVFIAWSQNSERLLYERQRVNGSWQGIVALNSSDTIARLQQFGQSLRGAANLVFVESPAGSVATGGVKFLHRTPLAGPPPSAPPPSAPPLSPPPPSPQAPTAPQPNPGMTSPNWYYFSETGHFIAFGFKAFWDENGGLPVFGFPLTEEFVEPDPHSGQTYTVQYLERQRFEYHPEHQGTPYEVQLGLLGIDDAGARGMLGSGPFQPRAPVPPDATGCLYFAETGHFLCGGFRAYWENHGLEFGDPDISPRESLALFGYPISEEFSDPATGLTIQYFERARFEYHPDNPEQHRVLLGRLGAELLTARGW